MNHLCVSQHTAVILLMLVGISLLLLLEQIWMFFFFFLYFLVHSEEDEYIPNFFEPYASVRDVDLEVHGTNRFVFRSCSVGVGFSAGSSGAGTGVHRIGDLQESCPTQPHLKLGSTRDGFLGLLDGGLDMVMGMTEIHVVRPTFERV